MQNAVDECIKRGILSEYLRKKGSEAVNMLIAEYDYDMDIKVQREEAKAEGIEQGLKLGKKEGIKSGTANAVIELMKELGVVPDNLKSCIIKETDEEVLKKWLKLAAKAKSIEEFQKEIKEEACME